VSSGHFFPLPRLILRDYGRLKYKKIDDPRPETTLESDEDWQAMNCVLDNGVRIHVRFGSFV
jgi:hypothetical protein